jgi:shikimate kinase
VRHYANITANLSKTLDVTGATHDLTCSFAGGCNLEVNAEGLSTMLKNNSVDNFISVCDEPCHFIELLSDSSKAVC